MQELLLDGRYIGSRRVWPPVVQDVSDFRDALPRKDAAGAANGRADSARIPETDRAAPVRARARRAVSTRRPQSTNWLRVARDSAIGEGSARRSGEAHAEVNAIKGAARRAPTLARATYVTLNLATRKARTAVRRCHTRPVSRAWSAMTDPNPHQAGGALTARGDTVGSALRNTRRELNPGFLSILARGRLVRKRGQSRRTTALIRQSMDHGPGARADGHAWRPRLRDLTGIGTSAADDPR